jgi:hypothetical protein
MTLAEFPKGIRRVKIVDLVAYIEQGHFDICYMVISVENSEFASWLVEQNLEHVLSGLRSVSDDRPFIPRSVIVEHHERALYIHVDQTPPYHVRNVTNGHIDLFLKTKDRGY